MDKQAFVMKFRSPVPPADGGYPGFNPRVEKAKGMVIERDAAVKMRDGVKIYADVFRRAK